MPHYGSLATGILSNSYGGGRAATDKAGGEKIAMVECFWDRLQLSQGAALDATELTSVNNRINDLIAKGFKISLGFGLHYPRAWVDTYLVTTDHKFKNQAGTVDGANDMVFNQAIRTLAEDYMQKLITGIGVSKIWSMRATSGGFSELLYPNGSGYWAYSPAALTGTGLATGQSVNPEPTWVAGTTHPLGTPGVQIWADWYIQSLANTVVWQRDFWRAQGFTGYIEVPMPGSGVHTNGYNTAIAADLPVGSVLRRGASWREVIRAFPDDKSIVPHQSGTADESGLPSNYIPLESDKVADLTGSAANSWGSARWMKACADEAGYLMSGENPGYGDTPNDRYKGINAYVPPLDMVGQIFEIVNATSKPFNRFYWAHDYTKFDGTVAASLYHNKIAAQPGPATVPDYAYVAPPAALLQRDFELGSPGINATSATVTKGVGSITVAGASTMKFGSGDNGLRRTLVIGAPASVDLCQFSNPLPVTTDFDGSQEYDIEFSNSPTTIDFRFGTMRNSAGTVMFLLITTAGKLRVQNSAGTAIWTSATTVVGSRMVIRAHCKVVGASTGSAEIEIYNQSNLTPGGLLETQSLTAQNFGTTAFANALVGKSNPLTQGIALTMTLHNFKMQTGLSSFIPFETTGLVYSGVGSDADQVFTALRNAGYTGSLNDMRRQDYLSKLGLTDTGIYTDQDLESMYLRSLGFTGSIPDMRRQGGIRRPRTNV